MAPSVIHEYTPDNCSITHENAAREQVPMAGTSAPVAAQTQSQPQNSGHAAFLNQWQQSIQPRLTQLLAHLGRNEVAKSLALAQVNLKCLIPLDHSPQTKRYFLRINFQ
jgi:hypothetical protein